MSTAESVHQDRNDGGDRRRLMDLLAKTSRTFALSIPLLPSPCSDEVAIAYLLFRIIDTFEDGSAWSPQRRLRALNDFVGLIEDAEGRLVDWTAPAAERAARAATEEWLRSGAPVAHDGYLELLRETPRVVAALARLRPAAAGQIARHVVRSARGMADFVNRTDGQGVLQLQTLGELRDYCFVVAGLVGEMLTELFLLHRQELAACGGQLRERARRFGEGLQLVNILKDATSDLSESRRYLPQGVPLAEVFILARADLQVATEYTEILRSAGADRGVVAFNALNTRLAVATLRLLREQGPGAKLSRVRVMGVAAEIMHALDRGAPLFPEQP